MPFSLEDLIRSQLWVYEYEIRRVESLYQKETDAIEKADHARMLAKLWDKKNAVQLVLENVLSEGL
ncbi:MAG TPA: hypothetical protein VHV10_02655 [Ktedonobacteraceae bacterium]|nr:hypothetical protein [Ktedonobacteraceae bacterium]